MSRGKRTDVALYEGIGNLPGVGTTGWVPGVGMPMGGIGGMGAGMGGGAEPKGESLFQLIDDRMRGRWTYALILGTILSAIAATVGYLSAEPMYISGGTIEVQREVRPILNRLEDLGITDYDRFCATQVEYIKSPQVLGEAVKDEKVKALNISRGMIKSSLEVERDRQSTLIFVQCESEQPEVAEASVNAVLRAYDELYARKAKEEIDVRLAELDRKVTELDRKLLRIDGDIRAITTTYNATDLTAVQKGNLDEINLLRVQINEGKRALARFESGPANGANGGAQVPMPAALMQMEPRLPQAQANRDAAEQEFELIKAQFKPDTAAYNVAERKYQTARDFYDRLYQATVDKWNKLPPEARAIEGMSKTVTGEDIKSFEVRLSELEGVQKKLVVDIANLAGFTYEQKRTQDEIDRMRGRMDAIELEMKPLNKIISVSAYGTKPDQPAKDARKTRLFMGLALGFATSFGAFFLLGTIDRRAFGANQLGLGGNLPPCLGVLPDLGASLSDPETSDVASHCVHQIRNQIEAVRPSLDGYTLCISSPFQGDGKTSIVMALGWSYAAAGYNTLVIDCDMIGRSLTRQLGLTGREGLREALMSKELNGSVNRLPWANLSAVPVGVDVRFGPENIRKMDLEKLLEQVRDKYDIIIIDTGPLLGSLESTPVTAVSDGVVFSVRRGRSRSKLEECVARLKIVGTPCIGVILNCAQRSDCNRYVSEASLAAAEEGRSGRPALPAQPAHEPGERNALVRAVKSTTRQRQDDGGASASDAEGHG